MSQDYIKADLSTFKKATRGMIATSDNAYKSTWGFDFNSRYKTYKQEEVESIVNSGSLEEKQQMSEHFFHKDGFYKRLLMYYSTLFKYSGVLVPIPASGKTVKNAAIQKKYYNALDFIEAINVPLFAQQKILKTLIYGTYYGLIFKIDRKGVVVIDLPAKWCRTRFKDFSGKDVIELNLGYFRTFLDENEREKVLASFPKYIVTAFRKFEKGKHGTWFFLPTDSTICSQLDGRTPFFLSTIPEITRYDDSVKLELERDREEIKKIIVQHVPHLNDGRLVFEPEEAEEMHYGTVEMLKQDKNINVLTSYGDVSAVVSKTTSDAVKNNIEKMLKNVYNKSGASSELFSSTGSATLSTSIKNDMALMSVLLNRYAAIVSDLVNGVFSNSTVSFEYSFLPITWYNEDEYLDNTFKLASSGYSFLVPSIASGIGQRVLSHLKDLENDVLNLQEKLFPLSSSYTRSNDDEGGGQTKKQEDKDPHTIETQDAQDNQY